MGTLLDIRNAVATELTRDDLLADLSDVLLRHIQDACETFASHKFWFNSTIATATTTSGNPIVSVPASVRVVERVTIPAEGVELSERVLVELPDSVVTQRPAEYAYYNNSLHFYPTPGASYTLNIYGIAQVDAPSADGDSSIWTNQAKALIIAQTKYTLNRDIFRDSEGEAAALRSVSAILSRMKNETSRRLRTPLRPRGAPWQFSELDLSDR